MAKVLAFFLPIFIGMTISTQNLAKKLQYHSSLGEPLFNYGETPVYLPFNIIFWLIDFQTIDILFKLAKQQFLWTMLGFLIGFCLLYMLINQEKKNVDYYGSAKWGTLKSIEKANLLKDKEGVILGFLGGRIIDDPKFLANMFLPLRYKQKIKNALNRMFFPMHIMIHDGAEHILMLAPTRSGKGVGPIYTTLTTTKRSVVVLDLKGENWALTSGYRQKVLGQKVLKFEPTNADGSAARFNPLAEIRKGTFYEIQDIQNVADILVNPTGKADMDHWAKAGLQLLVGVISHLLYAEENVSLARVAEFLQVSDDGKDFFAGLEELADFEHDQLHEGIFEEIYGHMSMIKHKPYTHPLVRQMAIDMSSKSENERKSIVSTCTTTLSLYSDPLLARNTAVSDFAIKDIMNSEQAVSLYIIIPPSDISRLGSIIRMVVELIIRRNTNEMDFKDAQPAPKYKHKLLLLLDEFPAIGRMDTLEQALAYIAGYGLKTLLIAQDLSQLNKTYTKDNSIVANCHIQIYFTPNTIETGEGISKLLGKRTIEIFTKSRKEKSLSSMFEPATESNSYIGRELMTGAELRSMDKTKSIISVAGIDPVMAEKFAYYEMKMFTDRLIAAPEKSDILVSSKNKIIDEDYEDYEQDFVDEKVNINEKIVSENSNKDILTELTEDSKDCLELTTIDIEQEVYD